MRRVLGGALLVLALLVLGELGARTLHDDDSVDFLFDWYFADAVARRAREAAEPNAVDPPNAWGFRGGWEPGPSTGRPRVIVTGAGDCVADNVQPGEGWPDQLRGQLRRRFGVEAELWNMAAENSTVQFVERGLLPAILASQPDVLILSHGGFNEALRSDIPDAWAIRPDSTVFNRLYSSQLVRSTTLTLAALARQVSGRERQHKVPVAALEAAYDRIIEAARSQEIAVVLLEQVIIYPDIEGLWRVADMELYRAAMARTGRRHGVPVVDPRSFMDEPLGAWFDEDELYAPPTHRGIATLLAPVVAGALGAPGGPANPAEVSGPDPGPARWGEREGRSAGKAPTPRRGRSR